MAVWSTRIIGSAQLSDRLPGDLDGGGDRRAHYRLDGRRILRGQRQGVALPAGGQGSKGFIAPLCRDRWPMSLKAHVLPVGLFGANCSISLPPLLPIL